MAMFAFERYELPGLACLKLGKRDKHLHATVRYVILLFLQTLGMVTYHSVRAVTAPPPLPLHRGAISSHKCHAVPSSAVGVELIEHVGGVTEGF